MNRTKGILGAATFTGVILLTILGLGYGDSQAAPVATALASTVPEVVSPATGGSTSDETLRAWQAYSTQLEETVRILQQRDIAYRQQLEMSNETIMRLQEQVNLAQRSFAAGEDHERGEHEELEGLRFGEIDD